MFGQIYQLYKKYMTCIELRLSIYLLISFVNLWADKQAFYQC